MKNLLEENRKYLFRATNYCDAVIEKGKGTFVWDINGKRYIDLNAGQFCLCFGHNYMPFNRLISKQLKKIYHTNTATITPEFFEAAKKMAEINDYKLTKTMFLSTGSEANEAALRYAKFYTKKNGVLSLDYGYHGLTLGSQSSTMAGQWSLPKVEGTLAVKTPDYIHSDRTLTKEEFLQDCIDDLDKKIKEYADQIGAFILEPVIGVGGMVPIDYSYLQKARELCSENNILLIFDECQCGFGRSGDWFVYQKANVVPDILVTAKAMGNGFAVSAITMKEEIANEIELKLTHFSSHQNDPISAAIVSFVINEIQKKEILKRNMEISKYLQESVKKICDETKILINPRSVGLMCAFDIDDSKIPDYREFSSQFVQRLKQNGVLIQAIRQGRTFRIMPNYLIKKNEIDLFKDACVTAIKEMEK